MSSFDQLPRFGNGFVLRRLDGDDLAAFQGYRHDPELGRYQGWSPMSDEQALAFLREMYAVPLLTPWCWAQVGIADPTTQRLIGDIGVFLAADERWAEIGFTLARHAQGRGVATAAVREVIDLVFAARAVDRVVAVTDARNAACVQLLERAGLRRTETTQTVFRGEPCVEYVYAADRHSWPSARAVEVNTQQAPALPASRMRARVTLITLGVDDLPRAVGFYRDGLGWETQGIVGTEFERGAVAVFNLESGLKLALWPRRSLATDSGLPLQPPAATDVLLAHNVDSPDDVDAVMRQARAAGAHIVKEARATFYGGYAGYFQDPDGHLWEVAFNPGLEALG